MTDKVRPGCDTCKHAYEGLTCKAYPKGIPLPILSGDISHTKNLPDDNGIKYEPAEQRPRKENG